MVPIRNIVFDLDGTLYRNDELQREITSTAENLIASSRGLSLAAARKLLQQSSRRLAENQDEEPTLSLTCLELGISIDDLHDAFRQNVRPERYLVHDPVLQALLEALSASYDLYIYSNNNLFLTRKILKILGVEDCFFGLYTIEFSGVPKPDEETLQKVLEEIGGPPESFLFVGDRVHVDLQLPARRGIRTMVARETADLLQIFQMLGLMP